ncbi:MAG TPA: NAD-dependent epimerase/dehydratase family protein [bacterium]|nr:NAD-dependent epimerase/dehydratase family protein [bacterium]
MATSEAVVLGATGGAGSAVVRELASRGLLVRAVSRSGAGPSLPGVTPVKGDATNPTSLRDVCRGARVVYHCVNVPYPQWTSHLIPIAEAIIAAATSAGAKLVVMDNLYMYGRPDAPMTETTPRNARGKKGRLRIRLEHLLLDAHRAGTVRVAIGRASDFYGPQANSAATMLVIRPAVSGHRASWVGSLDAPHTFGYLPDVAWGLVTLADHDEAFGEIWHLPAAEPLTGREFAALVFETLGAPPRIGLIPKPLMLLGGLFSPMIRESREVLYQFEYPFVMDAGKFSHAFGSRITSHRAAVRHTLDALRQTTPSTARLS